MVRPKEGNFKPIPLNLDPVQFKKFNENLPKHKSVSEVIREFIKDENDRKDREKKEIGLDNSPIKSIHFSSNSKQIALDKYFGDGFMDYKNWELRQKIFNEMTDGQRIETAIALNRHAKAWRNLQFNEECKKK